MKIDRGSPQIENGYLRIANELYDALLAHNLTGRQFKIVMAVLRKTYGYNKKKDDLSASQIGAICGIARNHVTEELNRLTELRVITKSAGEYGSVIGINKNHWEWIDPDDDAENDTWDDIKLVSISQGSPKTGLVPKQD